MNDIVRLAVLIVSLSGCSLAPGGQALPPKSDTATAPVETAPGVSETATATSRAATPGSATATSPTAPVATATATPPTVRSNLPAIDTSIQPVSLSKPSVEAAEALRICQVLDDFGADKVAGMGRISHARDAVHYAPLTGKEPEIATDDPAWLITFRGELPMPMLQQV